jgi:hypothetical protein
MAAHQRLLYRTWASLVMKSPCRSEITIIPLLNKPNRSTGEFQIEASKPPPAQADCEAHVPGTTVSVVVKVLCDLLMTDGSQSATALGQ